MRSRYFLFALVFIALHSMAAAQSENLIINPSNEEPIVGGVIHGWTMVAGNKWTKRFSNPSPKDGLAYFFAGDDGGTDLVQVVDVSHLASTIDANQQVFKFSGYVRSYPQTPSDISEFFVDYRNAAGTVLWEYHAGNSSSASWKLLTNTRRAPAETRNIRIRLRATRQAYTGNNDGYFDALSLITYPCNCSACQQCNTNGVCMDGPAC